MLYKLLYILFLIFNILNFVIFLAIVSIHPEKYQYWISGIVTGCIIIGIIRNYREH